MIDHEGTKTSQEHSTAPAAEAPVAPQEIFLHIGIGKTGSSWLQALIAQAIDDLSAERIFYPRGHAIQRARAGRISSGNGGRYKRAISGTLPALARRKRVLFSNEAIWQTLARDIEQPFLVQAGALHVLVFLRDPLEHAKSSWVQSIKRAGASAPLEEWLRGYPNKLFAVADCLEAVRDAPNAVLTAVNYSRNRHRLAAVFADFLGVPALADKAPGLGRINRSLTISELPLQSALNAVVEGGCREVADALCERIPDLKTDKPPLAEEATWRFFAAIEEPVAKLNAFLPEAERLALVDDGVRPSSRPTERSFTDEQIAAIAAGIADRLAKVRGG